MGWGGGLHSTCLLNEASKSSLFGLGGFLLDCYASNMDAEEKGEQLRNI